MKVLQASRASAYQTVHTLTLQHTHTHTRILQSAPSLSLLSCFFSKWLPSLFPLSLCLSLSLIPSLSLSHWHFFFVGPRCRADGGECVWQTFPVPDSLLWRVAPWPCLYCYLPVWVVSWRRGEGDKTMNPDSRSHTHTHTLLHELHHHLNQKPVSSVLYMCVKAFLCVCLSVCVLAKRGAIAWRRAENWDHRMKNRNLSIRQRLTCG